MIITISNIAGGDERRFRASTTDGRVTDVSGAAVRHARRQGWMGYQCSDDDAHEIIARYIEDGQEREG